MFVNIFSSIAPKVNRNSYSLDTAKRADLHPTPIETVLNGRVERLGLMASTQSKTVPYRKLEATQRRSHTK